MFQLRCKKIFIYLLFWSLRVTELPLVNNNRWWSHRLMSLNVSVVVPLPNSGKTAACVWLLRSSVLLQLLLCRFFSSCFYFKYGHFGSVLLCSRSSQWLRSFQFWIIAYHFVKHVARFLQNSFRAVPLLLDVQHWFERATSPDHNDRCFLKQWGLMIFETGKTG